MTATRQAQLGVGVRCGALRRKWHAHTPAGALYSQNGTTECAHTEKYKMPRRLAVAVTVSAIDYADAGPLSAKLLKHGTLKTYKGFPHGMCTTQADTINADLLAFIKG
jgi:non-heme chloroperoxidase